MLSGQILVPQPTTGHLLLRLPSGESEGLERAWTTQTNTTAVPLPFRSSATQIGGGHKGCVQRRATAEIASPPLPNGCGCAQEVVTHGRVVSRTGLRPPPGWHVLPRLLQLCWKSQGAAPLPLTRLIFVGVVRNLCPYLLGFILWRSPAARPGKPFNLSSPGAGADDTHCALQAVWGLLRTVQVASWDRGIAEAGSQPDCMRSTSALCPFSTAAPGRGTQRL